MADTYIDIVHRRLTRRGLRVWRYNDDWRITAPSWSEALRAVDVLEEEARRVGLTLNDSKTVIHTASTYRGVTDHRDAVLQSIAEEAELDLTDFQMVGPYEVILFGPQDSDIQLEANRQILRRYNEHRSGDRDDPQVFQTSCNSFRARSQPSPRP